MERPRAQSLDAAFLYISSPGDFGWTKTHEDARVELEEYFKGEGVKANFKTYNSVDRSNIAKAVDSLVEGGVEVIVTTSGEWKPEIAELADKHEDIKFLACSTFQEKENLQSFFGRMYQAKFLAGIVAARASETGVLGYVGSIQNHETMRHLNAFALGAYFITKQDAKQGLAADRDIEGVRIL